MSKENNKFNTSEVEVAGPASVAVLPPYEVELCVDAAKGGGNLDHLATDHLLSDLKGRTVSGAFVTVVAQGAQFLLSFVSIMALARLLTPRDFGFFAMAATVVGYLRIFKDAGLSIATVQREQISQAQVSNLFWINAGVSGA